MNLLQSWEISHQNQILEELEKAGIKFSLENISQIIHKTSYNVRSKKHPNKCPYYKTKSPCHPEIKDLNCFLCACPNYESEKLEGGCKINSKFGKIAYHKNLPKGSVWDCSSCTINHTPKEIKGYLRNVLKSKK